ncbi:MAG: hypothetical protein LIR46_01365 [Bacteroidota bacterium]|nr:hypothetical protein [Bacteroidota bacterium]
MKKIDVFQEFQDTETKRLQIVYLDYHGFTKEEIRKWTGYAVSTIKSYIRKFASLINKAKKTFYHITQKVKKVLRGGKQLVYLYKFYYENGELICSKVGTTTRLPEQRLNEEIKYYKKHGIAVSTAEICSVIDCGAIPAEGAESITRAYFIRKHPEAFCKNDRFFGVDIPTRTFNKIVSNYLSEGGLLTA